MEIGSSTAIVSEEVPNAEPHESDWSALGQHAGGDSKRRVRPTGSRQDDSGLLARCCVLAPSGKLRPAVPHPTAVRYSGVAAVGGGATQSIAVLAACRGPRSG